MEKLAIEKLSEDRLEKFKKILTGSDLPIAIVLTHLDPDSIACARIFAKICEQLGVDSRIFFCGLLDDPQNQFIWNKFKLVDDFSPIEKFASIKGKCRVALLDSSAVRDQRLGHLEIDPVVIIDHHPSKSNELEETEDKWYYIKTCGAAVSLVIHLFISLGLQFEVNDDMATLAIVGMKTDFEDMLRGSMIDIEITSYLLLGQYVDRKRALEVQESMLDKDFLKLFNQAYANMLMEGSTCVTHLDYLPRAKIGLTARIANEFCKYKGIDTFVIWSVSDDNLLSVKVRSVDSKIDLDDFIKKRFGLERGGAREGGKGAALVSLEFFAPMAESKEALLEFLKKHIAAKIFNYR